MDPVKAGKIPTFMQEWRNSGQSTASAGSRRTERRDTAMSTTTDLATIIEQAPEMPWLDRAACASLGVERLDLFFVDAGKSLSPEAKALCAGCEVRRDCLMHAYERDIVGGYFGGLSPTKRRKLTVTEALDLIEGESC